jgi:protein SCO1/2
MRRLASIITIVLSAASFAPAAAVQPTNVWQRVGFDQRLNAQVPLRLEFRDEQGRRVRLGDYFGAKPVVLVMGYYGCQNLCGVVMDSLLTTLGQLSFAAGDQFDVVAISIDSHETPKLAQMKKAVYLEQYHRPGAARGMHFLTGGATAVKKLARAVGFRYVYDADLEQFVHAAGTLVLTPEGRIARYFYGVQYPPRDLRLGLIEASGHRIGSLVDRVLLLCARYDPATGRYSVAVWNILRAACAVTAVAMGSFIFLAVRRERRAPFKPEARSQS